jgi:hypothetical protein
VFLKPSKKRRPLLKPSLGRRVRAKTAKQLGRAAAQMRSRGIAPIVSRAAEKVAPEKGHEPLLRAGRALNVNLKKLDRTMWLAGPLLAAQSIAYIKMPSRSRLEAILRAVAFGGTAVALYGAGRRVADLNETMSRVFASVISNPRAGREIAKRVEHKGLKNKILFLSRTKYIPAKEKKGIADALWNGEGKLTKIKGDKKKAWEALSADAEWKAALGRLFQQTLSGRRRLKRLLLLTGYT